jgi:hypothetical protein
VIHSQLQCGKDIAVQPSNIVDQQVFAFAAQMSNFVYVVADTVTREAMVVDAAWDVPGILKILKVRELFRLFTTTQHNTTQHNTAHAAQSNPTQPNPTQHNTTQT